jgi:hypothetical protein
MSHLYERALVIMPDKTKIPIQNLIDVVTLNALTPDNLKWVELMVKAQLERDGATDYLTIKPGMCHYIYRQIIYYSISAMMENQKVQR